VSWFGWVAIAVGVVLLSAVLVRRSYRRDLRAAYERLDSLSRRSVESRWGTIEYAIRGEGHPVLVVHGITGGFDQALSLAADHLDEGFMAIAPSRFGYLGTSMPSRATLGSQADALARLLDAVGVDRAAVMAYSAGGTPAIRLALRHPDRVVALALISTAPAGEVVRLPPKWLIRAAFSSDFVFWTLTGPFQAVMRPAIGVPRAYPLGNADRAAVADLMRSILPIEPRSAGCVFDVFVTNLDMAVHPEKYPLEEIAAPTLLVNAADDPLAKYEAARVGSRRIPGAKLRTVARGGHVFLGSGDFVRNEVTSFLRGAFHDR
jgi:pimeloyl-ACP methyl ester carboxylesterase